MSDYTWGCGPGSPYEDNKYLFESEDEEMYKNFECPDGTTIEIQSCLKQCNSCNRCLSLPTLRMIAEQRPWTGKPSTTQLLKGTREAYLEITHEDLTMKPKDQVFRLLGTKAHDILNKFSVNELSEDRLEDDNATGAFDLYDAENKTLYDYKTWGSYKVMKALGIEMVDVETGEYYKSGEKKGLAKTHKEPRQGTPDMKDTELQLNHYRTLIEAAGFPVETMLIEAVVRDGGTFSATGRGITENVYLIPVKRLPDEEVSAYFKSKGDALQKALETGISEPCTVEERWDDRKCKDYCGVNLYCKHYLDNIAQTCEVV
jgi:hypothetical protein